MISIGKLSQQFIFGMRGIARSKTTIVTLRIIVTAIVTLAGAYWYPALFAFMCDEGNADSWQNILSIFQPFADSACLAGPMAVTAVIGACVPVMFGYWYTLNIVLKILNGFRYMFWSDRPNATIQKIDSFLLAIEPTDDQDARINVLSKGLMALFFVLRTSFALAGNGYEWLLRIAPWNVFETNYNDMLIQDAAFSMSAGTPGAVLIMLGIQILGSVTYYLLNALGYLWGHLIGDTQSQQQYLETRVAYTLARGKKALSEMDQSGPLEHDISHLVASKYYNHIRLDDPESYRDILSNDIFNNPYRALGLKDARQDLELTAEELERAKGPLRRIISHPGYFNKAAVDEDAESEVSSNSNYPSAEGELADPGYRVPGAQAHHYQPLM